MRTLYTLLWAGGYYTMLLICLFCLLFPTPPLVFRAVGLLSLGAAIPNVIAYKYFPMSTFSAESIFITHKKIEEIRGRFMAPVAMFFVFLIITFMRDDSHKSVWINIILSIVTITSFAAATMLACPSIEGIQKQSRNVLN